MTPDRRRRLTSGAQLGLWLKFFAAGALVCELSLLVLGSSVQQQLILVAVAVGCLTVAVGAIALFGAESVVGRIAPAITGLTALAAAGLVTHGLAPALGGFFVLTFVYVGLTQPAWTSVALVPLATAGWLVVNRPIVHSTFARMPVAVSLWILLGELLSRFSAERDTDKRRLAEQATNDALTGLRNRHGLDQLLGDASVGDTIAFIDLDHFKQLNDVCGHDAGDRALADLGRAVRAALRVNDIAVRYGGEEILVLLPATTVPEAVGVTTRIRDAWNLMHPELTFSAGVAPVGPAGGVEAARQADSTLYLAKERGRDRTEIAPLRATRPPVPEQGGGRRATTPVR